MRPPPTTLEIVEAWALQDPHRAALREGHADLTYGQFAHMLLQCGRRLHELGLRKGQRVAISGPGFGIQLVLLLACEALGAVTASFQADQDSDAPFLFTQVDWVFSALPQHVPAGVRFVQVDQAFADALGQPLQGPEPAWTPADLEDPQRISRTSGSTGTSKFMLLRRRAQELWIRSPLDVTGYGRDTRLLVIGPLVINAVFGRTCNCLRQGGMLLAGEGGEIARMDPTHIFGLPAQLERLLEDLPPGYRSSRPVMVGSTGGLVTPGLRERAFAVFGGRIASRYGSNEVGPVCDDLDAGGAGFVTPGVEVRILDADGYELPPGEQGIIAVRTPTLADGYLDRPDETAAAFRDGWFISGDVGAMIGRRRLQLAGRHDDLVNVGGIKIAAATLEERLRAQPAITDACVLAVNLEGGAVTLGVALVLAAGASRQDAERQLPAALQLDSRTLARVLLLEQLPRMHTGKTDRMALLRQFQAG